MSESFLVSRRRITTQSQINLVPFIDVLLILVVLLMTSFSTLQQSMIVDLPKDSSSGLSEQLSQEPLMLSLTSENEMFLEHSLIARQALDPKSLFIRLKALKVQNLANNVFVAADKDCQYNDVMEMISLVNQAGYTKVTLVTEKDLA